VERSSRAVRFLGRPVVLIAIVTLAAGWIRFVGLSRPDILVFDETYYAVDACLYLNRPLAVCNAFKEDENKLKVPSEQSWVHPPLGKYMIAAGEAIYGVRPFGWRFSSALFGTLTVTLVALIAYRLTRSALWAGVAGVLLGVESLNFVQSRMSMLDIFEAFWVVAGFLFLVLDRQWIDRRQTPSLEPVPLLARSAGVPAGAVRSTAADAGEPPEELADQGPALSYYEAGAAPTATWLRSPPASYLPAPAPQRVPSPIWRPWRFAAGAALGLATAVKWSAVTALAGAAILSFFWEIGRRRRAFRRSPIGEAMLQESLGLVLSFLFVPAVAYLATYVPWLHEHGWSLRSLVGHHRDMWDFHAGLQARKPNGELTHPYQSEAWSWPFLRRPVAYFYEGTDTPPTSAEILGIGNPVIFWGSLFAIPFTVFAWARRRDWIAGVIAIGFLSQYLPWLAVSRPAFLFYMTPITPFMVLAGAYALRHLAHARLSTGARAFAPAAGFLVVLAVGVFAFFVPVLVGHVISRGAWNLRMWFPSWV